MREWRFCNKCFGMFFDGRDTKGRCPAGGEHVAQGYNFDLPVGRAETPNQQLNWRYCTQCGVMFFDGYPEKGRCPVGTRVHRADRSAVNFLLPHDVPGEDGTQNAWRFCDKCFALFYDGYPAKGNCSAGGGHHAAGYDFVLPRYPRPQRID